MTSMPAGAAAASRRTTSAVFAAFGTRNTSSARDQVGDEIVDHAAGVVTAQRVLGLARRDPAEVVGQAVVHELRRSGPAHPRLAEVGYIEQADGLPYGGMLAQHTAAARGVFNGHLPAAEVGELGC